MYDYRNVIKQLIDNTTKETQSLKQTAIALNAISTILLSSDTQDQETKSESEITDIVKQANIVADKTESNSNKRPDSDPEPYNQLVNYAPNAYLAKHLLSGYSLIDHTGTDIGYYSESLAKHLYISNGDILQLNTEGQKHPEYVRTIGHLDLPSNITTFDNGIVEIDNILQKLVIRKNVNNKQLSLVNGTRSSYTISPDLAERFNITTDSIVDLAWYNDNPNNIQIRWSHNIQDLEPETSSEPAPKKTPAKQNNHVATNQDLIDMDLIDFDDQIAIVSGDNSTTQNIDTYFKNNYHIYVNTIELAHGDSEVNILNKLQTYRVIILIKNHISHAMSKAIIKNFSDTKYIAVANGSGQKQIAMAVYRAVNGLSYDDNSDIDYPIK